MEAGGRAGEHGEGDAHLRKHCAPGPPAIWASVLCASHTPVRDSSIQGRLIHVELLCSPFNLMLFRGGEKKSHDKLT